MVCVCVCVRVRVCVWTNGQSSSESWKTGPYNFLCSDLEDQSVPEQTYNIGSTVD
jgi:hypothetical protein